MKQIDKKLQREVNNRAINWKLWNLLEKIYWENKYFETTGEIWLDGKIYRLFLERYIY